MTCAPWVIERAVLLVVGMRFEDCRPPRHWLWQTAHAVRASDDGAGTAAPGLTWLAAVRERTTRCERFMFRVQEYLATEFANGS